MFQSKDFLWLIQAPSKHISRNGGATIKPSRKTPHEKVFFILGQKGHFFSKNGGTIKKTPHEKVFIILGQKGHFFSKNGGTIKKRL